MVKHASILLILMSLSISLFAQNPLHCKLNLQLDVLKEQLQKGADGNRCDSGDHTPLYWAGIQGQPEIIRFLLEAGANQRSKSEALYIAASNGHIEAVQLLLEAKADLNGTNNEKTALLAASENGELAVIETLLQAGASINQIDAFGWTAPMLAAYSGHFHVAKMLIENGAQRKGIKESTFLGAVQRGDSLLLELLPLKNIDMEVRDFNGWPALITAADKRYSKITQLLLQNGSNVNAVELEYGATPLMFAASNCDIEIIKMLLNAGSDISLKTKKNETPLMFSSFRQEGEGCLPAVKLLVEAGAQTDVKNDDGKSAIDLFAEQGKIVIADYLKEASAKKKTKF